MEQVETHADEISCVGLDHQGETRLIWDKNTERQVKHIMLLIPTKLTKCKLVCPTIHGNTLVGPTAENLTDKEDKSTTAEGLASIAMDVRNLVPNINLPDTITQYCGLRPNRNPEGLHVDTCEDIKNYVNLSGVRSTGLAASLRWANMWHSL